MSSVRPDPVVPALRNPAALLGSGLPQWETRVRQARRTNLLPRAALAFDELGLLSQVPPEPRAHFVAARLLGQAQADAVRREIEYIDRALAAAGVPVVLLKGAAYLFAGLRAARGRIFSDIDILVPRSALAQVEAALMRSGWATAKTTPYDQRYYRQWMHELPPLKHISRQTVLDVHHAILPTTARLKPDSMKLLAASQPIGASRDCVSSRRSIWSCTARRICSATRTSETACATWWTWTACCATSRATRVSGRGSPCAQPNWT